jgi:TIR domain-containing protein
MRTVFVSYRRGDSEGQARALNFELVKLIGKDSVFMDVDSIALGRDFRQILHERLESCDLMLVLIGPGWLDAKDAAGNRRLETATDLVRQEIAAALKRNIPVTPVLLQGAQMPPPERLPEDIRELVYRNGFELGHSTWESDVSEMVKRFGLDKESVAPTPAPDEAHANPGVLAVSKRFKTSWVLATFVVIAIVAAMLFYRKAHDQTSGSEIAASLQQPAGSSPQQPAGLSPQQPAESSPQQSAGSQPAGFGEIRIANLKTRAVEVYDQNSSGDATYSAGYAGSLTPAATTLQVPAGTYKLKFAKHFVERVAVASARSSDILLGTISLPNLTRTAEVYDQSSSGDATYSAGYAGSLTPTTTTLQVPAGTYKLKFANLFGQPIRVESGKTVIAR